MQLIITGFARSGTTYLANKLPIPMWDTELVCGEDASIWAANTAEFLLGELDESTIPVTYKPSEWFMEQLWDFKTKMCDKYESWGIKEPRISRLLPAYLEVFDEAEYIVCVRNPVNVVNSQNNRIVENLELVPPI